MITLRNLLDRKGRQVFTITSDVRVSEALRVFTDRNIGALLVVDDGRVQGIFSERDFTRHSLQHQGAGLDLPVSRMMTSPVVTVHPDRSVEDCLTLMTDRRFRHLPVVEGDALVGVVSIGDLVKATLDQRQFVIEQLESYISGVR